MTTLPALTRPGIVLDGTTQTAFTGNTNTANLGTGGTAGVDGLPLPKLDPEIAIVSGVKLPIGLDVAASYVTIKGLDITGFGYNPTAADVDGNIRVRSGTTSTLITGNVIGSSAINFNDPGLGARSEGNGVSVAGLNGTISGNLIGFSGGFGINLASNTPGWTIQGNEVRGSGLDNPALNGIQLNSLSSGPIGETVKGNLVAGSLGAGIEVDSFLNSITDNTVIGNGIQPSGLSGGTSAGIRVTVSSNTVSKNVLEYNAGAGVLVTQGVTAVTLRRTRLSATVPPTLYRAARERWRMTPIPLTRSTAGRLR